MYNCSPKLNMGHRIDKGIMYVGTRVFGGIEREALCGSIK